MRRLFTGAGLALTPSAHQNTQPATLPSSPDSDSAFSLEPASKNSPQVTQPDSDSEWDTIKLPFSEAAFHSSSSSNAPGRQSAHSHHARQPSVPSTTSTSVDAHRRVIDSRDDLLMELAAGQILVDAEQYKFEVLDLDKVELLRQEQESITKRIKALEGKYLLETSVNGHHHKNSSSGKISPLETSLNQAGDQARLNEINSELYKLSRKESELSSKLLRHSTAVLARTLKRRDREATNTSDSGYGSSVYHHQHSSSSSSRQVSSDDPLLSSTSSKKFHPFDGPHLYASQADAASPRSATVYPNSPSTASKSSPSKMRAYAALEEELEESKLRLGNAEQNIETLRHNLSLADEEVRSAQAEAATAREQARTAAEQAEKIQRQLELQEEEFSHLEQTNESRHDELSRELGETNREHKQMIDQLETERNKLTDAQTKLVSAQKRIQELESVSRSKEMSDKREHDRIRLALNGLFRRYRTIGGSLAQLVPENVTFQLDQERGVEDFTDMIDNILTRVRERMDSLELQAESASSQADRFQYDLRADLEKAEEEAVRARDEVEFIKREMNVLESTYRELDLKSQEQARQLSSRNTLERELEEYKTRETTLKSELADAKSQGIKQVQEIWKTLPTTNATRPPENTKFSVSQGYYGSGFIEELKGYKDSLEKSKKRLGSFSLDLRSQTFSIESFAERVRILIEDHQKIVAEFVKREEQWGLAGKEFEQSQEALRSCQSELTNVRTRMNQMEEHSRVSADKEVDMLERLNSLQEDTETMRGEKRRLESMLTSLNKEFQNIQSQKTAMAKKVEELEARPDESAKMKALETELYDVKAHLAAAEDEMDDMRTREQKQRLNLLDELNRIQEEATSLRTQLRQEQRRNGR